MDLQAVMDNFPKGLVVLAVILVGYCLYRRRRK
jgi:hypothetical protein